MSRQGGRRVLSATNLNQYGHSIVERKSLRLEMEYMTSFAKKESIKEKAMLRRMNKNGLKFCNVGRHSHCCCIIAVVALREPSSNPSVLGSSNDSLLAKVGQAMSGITRMYCGHHSEKLAVLEPFHGAASLGAVKWMHLLE